MNTKGCEEFEITPDTLNLKDPKGIHISLKPVKYSVSGRISAPNKIPDMKLVAKSEMRQIGMHTLLLNVRIIMNFFGFGDKEFNS